MGGIQYPHLNNLTRMIWQWCEARSIWLYASHINTRDNVEADEESRRVNPDIEWVLTQTAFNKIVTRLGVPNIDLFASRTNAKCETYVSWKCDPDAFAIDSFILDWKPWIFYAFPPFSLILKCLHKICHDKAEGIFIYPVWVGQPWFPLLNNLITSNIIYLDPKKDFILPSHRSHIHQVNQFTLAAAKLSGSRFRNEARRNHR